MQLSLNFLVSGHAQQIFFPFAFTCTGVPVVVFAATLWCVDINTDPQGNYSLSENVSSTSTVGMQTLFKRSSLLRINKAIPMKGETKPEKKLRDNCIVEKGEVEM